MNTRSSRLFFCAGFTALLLTANGFAQGQGQAQAPAGPVEYPKAQLETEQRVMKANIADANYQIDRGIKAVSANLPDLAKVSLLRATGRVAQVDEVMKSHPERIERVAMVLFTSREEVRKPLRASFKDIRDEFGAVELAMYAFRKDMLRKGIFGDDLKQQVAVLDAASKVLPELEKKDPALAEKVRSKIDEINQALAAGDNTTADKLIKELNGMLEGAGFKQNVQDAKNEINKDDPSKGMGPATTGPVMLRGGGSLEGGGGGVALTSATGQTGTIPGATPTSGGKVRLADGTEVDANGATVLPDGSIRLADGRVIKNGKIAGGDMGMGMGAGKPAAPTANATLVGADGEDLGETTDDYQWDPSTGEGKGVNKAYTGGKGMNLRRETKVTVHSVAVAGKPNTFELTKTIGESRTWSLVVGPVAGSDKKSTGSLTLTLALSDSGGATAFDASKLKWDISSPSGSPALSSNSGAQVTVTFSKSDTYAIQVSGVTDWGSPFVIKGKFTAGIE